ncbi:uncharacterized protein LOC129203630 isoform X2 [Grus americana]|uniref:uncharacterized protein LOC129203630 isoform X2 n=1 Tax=Grus americana TaxID=9117 RepID=UPI002407CD42|nr:uncharacterized protein LOC129203630 isoform X2 [Grus americana]
MVYCSALNCQNATSGVYKNNTVTFYGFPLQNKPLLKQWIHNMGRDMGTPSKHQRLCSKHFEDSSFEIDPLKIRKNRRLLKEAVPKKFILSEDGNWLVGTPRSFCGGISNKTRKRIRNPEHSRVPGTFDNAAAREGKDLEDWQKELHKKVIKENYESLTTLGKECPVPKSTIQAREALRVRDQQDFEERGIPAGAWWSETHQKFSWQNCTGCRIRGRGDSNAPLFFFTQTLFCLYGCSHSELRIFGFRDSCYTRSDKGNVWNLSVPGCGGTAVASELQSHPKSAENTELHGSFSGGPRDLTCQILGKGVTSESHQDSAAHQANPVGSRREGLRCGRWISPKILTLSPETQSTCGERCRCGDPAGRKFCWVLFLI